MSDYQNLPATQQRLREKDTSDNLMNLVRDNGDARESSTLGLVRRLCLALETERINYCHWKSNNALDRSSSGENDLDLLVSRSDTSRLNGILSRLGFKQAKAPAEKQMPGVLDYFGYDEAADKLAHVHVHYQLILGHDMTKNYRLPIERQYLESSSQGNLFRVPEPEYEFVVFIIRMILKHSTWDVILWGEGALKTSERKELAYLQARINRDRVDSILKQHLPYIGAELFQDCIRVLGPGCSIWTRVKIGQKIQTSLQTSARRSPLVDVCLKSWRRVTMAIRRRIFKSSFKYRLESGGGIIAIVGGDGAGKTTAVEGIYSWLSKHFDLVQVHLGKPDWSWTTITIRAILKIGNLVGLYPVDSSFRDTLNQKSLVSPGYPWLLREVCRSRDRFRSYMKARRFAANGGLVILDRFSLPMIQLMDGPLAELFINQLMDGPLSDQLLSPRPDNRITKSLIKLENSYYSQIVFPELLVVLRLDPEIAVQRKTIEDPISVRERSTEIWELNWDGTEVNIIDASKSKSDVLTEIKALIWSEL